MEINFKEFLNMEQYVHIDDERPPKPELGALWLKNYSDALNWVNSLNSRSIVKRVNFDNDIGDTNPGHDGYDILKRLFLKIMDGTEIPSEIMIHTKNSENYKAMTGYIKNFCQATDTAYTTYKENYRVYNQELNESFLVEGLVFVFDKID